MQTETTVFNLFILNCLAGAHSNNEKAKFLFDISKQQLSLSFPPISQNRITCICSCEIKASPIEAFTPQFSISL